MGDGYRVELSAATYWPNVKTAVLLLDADYRPIEEHLRIETGSETYNLKFVRTSFERKPTVSIPDRVFQPDSADLRGQVGAHAEIGPQALQIELAEAYILPRLHSGAGIRKRP
jgi:hypothetical protein